MKSRHLIVVEPGRIELQELDIDAALEPHQVLVEAEYTIVSAGTEGAGFTGLVREMPFGDGGTYPRGTGYGHLGRVLEVGSGVEMCRAGDRVLSFSRHASRWSRRTPHAWRCPCRTTLLAVIWCSPAWPE